MLRGPTSTSAPLSSEAQAANIQASCLRRHQAKRGPLIKRFTGLESNPKGFKFRAYLPKKEKGEQWKEQTEEERKQEEKRKKKQRLHLPFLERGFFYESRVRTLSTSERQTIKWSLLQFPFD